MKAKSTGKDLPTPSNTILPESVEEHHPQSDAISTRAYFLWEKAGRPDGRDDEFWLAAESELSAEQAAGPQTEAQ